MWPAFALCLVADIVLLHELPPAGAGISVADAFLLGGVLKLVIVAVLAPLAALLLRRRRPDLPRVVAGDYAGTALLLVGARRPARAGARAPAGRRSRPGGPSRLSRTPCART